jgi:hypothetical protein
MKKYLYIIGFLILAFVFVLIFNLKTSWGDLESVHKDVVYAVTCQNHGIQISWLRIEWVSSRDHCQNI